MKNLHYGEAIDDNRRSASPLADHHRQPSGQRYEHRRLLSGKPYPSLFYIWHRKFREQQPFAGGFVELTPGRPDDAASGIRIRLGVKLSILSKWRGDLIPSLL